MSWHAHPDATRIVREHWSEAECFVVAHERPCIEIRDEEVANRYVHGGFPKDLAAWNRPRIWFVAVVVCPDDDLTDLARFVADEQWDPTRFHFYLHRDAPVAVLRPWAEAGLPLDRVDTEGRGGAPMVSWGALNALLGLHFNLQILADALPHGA
jgi:hypothetical protein